MTQVGKREQVFCKTIFCRGPGPVKFDVAFGSTKFTCLIAMKPEKHPADLPQHTGKWTYLNDVLSLELFGGFTAGMSGGGPVINAFTQPLRIGDVSGSPCWFEITYQAIAQDLALINCFVFVGGDQ